jgi:hypothetical protein
MSRIIAACGLDCAACETYQAHQTQDQEKKKDIAARWSEHYDAKLTADEIACDGCMSNGAHFGWCERCPIRTCVQEKGFDTCAECEIFTCEKNAYVFQVAPQAKALLEELRSK